MRKLVVGSRRSGLAMTQSKQFIKKLQDKFPDLEIEIKEIVTKGDQIVDVQLSKVGGKGLFVKEIEAALENKEIDMAIHSLKDVPSELPEGFTIACVPEREDMRDAYLSNDKVTFKNLKPGSVVGTSSLRRGAQLKAMRDDITVNWVRGNIDTRIKKMENGEYDAILLAAAGLKRMGWSDDVVTEYFEPEEFIPAIAQGALGIEVREDDHELIEMLKSVHSDEASLCTTAERTFLKRMDGSCQVPIGGYATVEDGELYLTGLIMSEDGNERYLVKKSHEDPETLGNLVADEMEKIGAKEIIDMINENNEQ
ncbi:hydroxymethylbilane synthase [Jeotgalicoccus huakuii]|uniref:hydroxymethylbilane synthase n=1 Tax=Jeotgalicoccus TaxID=227979 RepID=UPI0004188AAA|nr:MULTISPECIES: hydroxymethylbilane synthase [Jeotgalicoccus]MCK1977029.1 hydroxymethylbilane synthase [Jeotgalicoccus huakuii]QQD85313.1 hydroxymethylbilane synthase [Jeotgalicoccus sp. ATCC 8456]